jgi:hypothetical protein
MLTLARYREPCNLQATREVAADWHLSDRCMEQDQSQCATRLVISAVVRKAKSPECEQHHRQNRVLC